MEKVRLRIRKDRVPTRTCRARIHYVKPDPLLPFVVQVFISPTQPHMRAAVRFQTQSEACSRTAGMVQHYFSKANGRFVIRPRQVIAHMFLNAADLKRRPSEIVAHECTHAGLAWGRLRKAKLKEMEGEEVVCYSAGIMTAQVNRICFMMGIWP